MRSHRQPYDVMGFSAYLGGGRGPVAGLGQDVSDVVDTSASTVADTASGWGEFWGGVSGTSTGDSAAGGIGSVLGNLITAATPALLNQYVYGQKPATPGAAPPAGFMTGPGGKLVPIQAGGGAAAGIGVGAMALIGLGVLAIVMSRK